MKIKRLEMVGFKSFPEKTSIEFSPGISAVVGPNGCGKSNIIDALKWVMGEQSTKQLRGKLMEDVIFAGADGKPPLNVAEASLTLENDNGAALEELSDFTEIMLTRRLYRSGESAYFINKQPCRLKDIYNIFLGSGIGTKSYSVIQQGNIGAIIEATPEEKRFFIEEAAGVTRYKDRKKEALRKVEATNQDLLRVADILAEVKRQMTGLKRQAKKAEIYKDHQGRIKRFDVFITLRHYHDCTGRFDEIGALLKGAKDAEIGYISRLKSLDAAVGRIRLERQQKGEKISEQKSRRFEIQRSIDRVENDLAHLRKEVERLANEAAGFESSHRKLEEKKSRTASEIDRAKSQNTGLKEKIKGARSLLGKEESSLQNIKNRLSRLNQELEDCREVLVDLITQKAQYKNIYQNTASNKESLKRRLKKAEEEEATAAKKVAILLNQEDVAREQFGSLKDETDVLSGRIEIVQKQFEKKKGTLVRQTKFIQTLESEQSRLRSEYTTLKRMEDSFEWYKGGVKAIMKARCSKLELEAEGQNRGNQNLNLPDMRKLQASILGLVADIIEPEPSFETAVEAALGESLQYILVKDQEAGIGLIDHLQTTGSGRCGFVPVSSVRQVECDQQQRLKKSHERLLNYVSVKKGFESVAESLLGHVVVSSSIEEAAKTFSDNSALQAVVTKEGDAISHQGIMIGGSKDNLSGILIKRQELKRLDRKIVELDQRIKLADCDRKGLKSDVRIIEDEMQGLIERKNRALQNKIEAEKTFYKATEGLKHVRYHLEIARLEQERLLGEEDDAGREMVKQNSMLIEIKERIKAAQDKVTERLKRVGSIQSEMENFNRRIVDLKLELTTLNARLGNSNNSLRQLGEFQGDGIEQLKKLSIKIAQKKEEVLSSKQKIVEYKEALSGMYDDMKLLEQSLEENKIDYQRIDAKLKESDAVISKVQDDREKTLQRIRLLELDLSQRQIEREGIASRLKERYHRLPSELESELRQIPEDLTAFQKMSISKMEDELSLLRKRMANIGDVNLGAIKEYEQVKARFDFLSTQRDDLVKAIDDLHKVIKRINRVTQKLFIKTFNLVNEKLDEVFSRLFEGGSARLLLTKPDMPLETGVELMVHPPGKRLTRMSLLSGGEKALSAIAFIFSVFLIKPAPFCLMDEIDTALDDANILRFTELLKIIGEKSQIIMVTHNKRSMEFADTLFGITTESRGISKIVSVNLKRLEQSRNEAV